MTIPKVYKTEAIVLRRSDLGEADRILTLYTPYLGKLRAVAKGVRKTTSKLGGHVELLTHCSLMLARGQNLDIVTQGQAIESFSPLRRDLWRLSCALYLAELVDAFSAEGAENYQAFSLLLEALHSLCQQVKADVLLRYFELHLLHYLGYQPQLQQCLNCKASLNPTTNLFSASGGGMLCPDCAGTEPLARLLSVDALKVLRFLQGSGLAAASRLRLSAKLSGELEQITREYIRYLLERELKSTEFLDRLRRDFAGDLNCGAG